jgi:hypothetical protein
MSSKVELLEYILREKTRFINELVAELKLYQASIPSTKCCKAYIKGLSCWAGPECRFKHPSKGQCYKWIETGKCKYGDKCMYTHPVEEEEEPYYDEDEDAYAEAMKEHRRNMHEKLEYEES